MGMHYLKHLSVILMVLMTAVEAFRRCHALPHMDRTVTKTE